MDKYDVVIVGSGIGGLCCGSILALSGKTVLICEAHTQPGGVAHSFKRKGYTFESGPSLWSGIGKWPTTNPLGQILKLLDEEVELFKYKGWQVIVPEGNFNLDVGEEPFKQTIKTLRGEKSVKEWESFISGIKPLSQIINEIPLLSFSPESINFLDLINLTSKFLPNIKQIPKINKGFGSLVNPHLEDPFLRNWVNLLSFLISGMSMNDTNTAAMATLFNEWFEPNSYLEYPKGGSESIVKALINGFKKNGGELILSSRVKTINFNKNLATGITLNNGSSYSCESVVTNTDVWNLKKLIPNEILKKLNFPVFVKPSNSGSSLGISKVKNESEILQALEKAREIDPRILIEEGLEVREIECGIIGNSKLLTSEIGEVKYESDWYDYDSKYHSNNKIIIPAEIDPKITKEIKEIAIKSCRALNIFGFARVDFFLEKSSNKILINEINTIPGFTKNSMFPMLWKASGLKIEQLVAKLVDISLDL